MTSLNQKLGPSLKVNKFSYLKYKKEIDSAMKYRPIKSPFYQYAINNHLENQDTSV